MSDWDFDIFGGSGSDYVPTSSDFSSGQDLASYFSGPSYDGDSWDYGSDLIGSSYYGEPQTQSFTIGPDQTAASAYYGGEQLPLAAQQGSSGGGIWDMLQSAGRAMESPGGKLGVGLFGAGISAYGANRANKNAKDAYKKQQAMLAARQAKAAQYDSPLRLASVRQAAGVPAQRGGEGEFFTNNRLPSYFAEGGGVSDEDFARMQQEAYQGSLDAQMDRPSAMGFLRYMMAGKRMPSEIAAAKRAQRPDVIAERNRALREAAQLGDDQPVVQRACGGSTNYVEGGTAGQDDKIPARLSDGEYVMDADVVSALGDGNNAAGAKKLDQMRQGIRAHKRSAPVNKIPPKAKSPLAYLKKGAK